MSEQELTEQDFNILSIDEQYRQGVVSGWTGSEIAKEQFELLGGKHYRDVRDTNYSEPKSRKMMLYQFIRKLLGKDIINRPQQSGDCVSWASKHAVECLQAIDIVLNNKPEKFREVFAPWIYSTSRVKIGGNRLWGAGSNNIWAVQANQKYGILFSDEKDCPNYSGRLADQWGTHYQSQFEQYTKNYLLKTYAKINSVDEALENILNGRPVTLASNILFANSPSSDGFHHRHGRGGHATHLWGADFDHTPNYFVIQNSWGPILGTLKDFDTGEELPQGCWRVLATDVADMISENDSFAYSSFEGFPDVNSTLQESLFRLI